MIPKLMKRNFLSGLLVLIPLGVIAWVGWKLVGFIWAISNTFPAWLEPEAHWSPTSVFFFRLLFTVGAWSAILIGISLLGFFSKIYLGKQFLRVLRDFLQRIPVLGSIYSSLDQVMNTFSPQESGKKFSRVVYVEYPRTGCWAVAFVTGAVKNPIAFGEGYLNLFVPAVPNPTAGFHLLVPESQVKESGMSVEEAFRNILSLGLVQPRG